MKTLYRWAPRLILGKVDAGVVSSETDELYRRRVERDGKTKADRWLQRERRRAVLHFTRKGHRRMKTPEPNGPGVRGRQSLANTVTQWGRGFRSSLHSLARAPVFALTVISTLALGIGGTTAVFSVVDSVLIQPLPYPEPSELVRISNHARGNDWVFSVADYLALEEQ